ncbi:MAG: glycosyltransferase [Flavobacteriales bacterium]|nr:glycosyltransferase [Flavobacteriales bacterium]
MRDPEHVLVITYWSYADALVQTYTLPYLRIMLDVLPPGSSIHLVTLEKDGNVEPVQDAGIVHHPYAYHSLGIRGSLMIVGLVRSLVRVVRRSAITTIHAWCTPAGMIGYLVSMITGCRLILDSYEPHAEAMVENGTWSSGGTAFRVLFFFERLQSRRAQVLIAATEGMREYAKRKYGVEDKPFYVKPACVDLEKFSAKDRKDPELLLSLGLEDKFVIVYAGKFGGIYLDMEVFEFLREAYDHWGDRVQVLLLTSHSLQELMPSMELVGLPTSIFTIKFVPHNDVPRYMGLGDLALTPVRPVPTKRYCTPIKDGEYWALGLPVIITAGISDDSDIIAANGIGAVLEGLDKDSYRKAIGVIDHLLATQTPEQRYRNVRAVAKKYRNFEIAKSIYSEVYGK